MGIGRGTMKELKVRLEEKEYKRLVKSAKKALRSVNKQVTVYILKGIETEKQEQVS